ncbi:MAG: hypothetical protein HRU11_12340, partial [Parvularculaceae bacterium]|nr:hypothetical protein [Parvularculaceae bacterium]
SLPISYVQQNHFHLIRFVYDGANLTCYLDDENVSIVTSNPYFDGMTAIGARGGNRATINVRSIKYWADASRSNLVHHWDARNISGTTWTDSVGSNDGTLVNGPTVVDVNEAEIWALIPELTAGLSGTDDTVIQIHADGVSSDYAATDTYGRNAVWSDYEFVGHDCLTDSTGNHTATAVGGVSSVTGGPIGNAAAFDGNGDYITLPATMSDSLVAAGAFTLQGIANLNSLSVDQTIVGDWRTNGADRSTLLYMDADGAAAGYRGVTAGGGTGSATFNLTSANVGGATANQWDWASSTFSDSGNRLRVFTNGSLTDENSSATANIHDPNQQWFIGYRDDQPTNELDGELAEVRIRATELSSAWIADEYSDQDGDSDWHNIVAVGGGPSPGPTLVMRLLLGGVWVTGQPHILVSGTWVPAVPHALVSGSWVQPNDSI